MEKNQTLYHLLTQELPDKFGRYIVLDTDTTGLDIKEHKLISISAVEIINGHITGFQFNATLRKRDIVTKKNNKHYYMNDYASEGTYEIEKYIMENFLRFINDSKIFAHNAQFDFQFILNELNIWGLPIIHQNQLICTLKLSKIVTGEKRTLESLCKYFAIDCNKEDFHNGLYDTYMLARVVCKIFGLYDKLKEEDRQNQILNEQVIPMELTLIDDMRKLSLHDTDKTKIKNLMKNYLSIK
jgi:DNA polymerase III epsilon subunit-like protein